MEKLQEMEREEVAHFYEIWITTSEAWPQDPKTTERECLWRSDRELTQDVKIEEAHFQNLPRLWLVVKSLDDSYVRKIEQVLGKHFEELKLKGEFAPVEKPKVSSDEKNTDLRS